LSSASAFTFTSALDAGRLPPALERLGEELYTGFYSFLLALVFLNCKNVVAHDVTPPRGKMRSCRNRPVPRPLAYKVLEIRPMQAAIAAAGSDGSAAGRRPLHICRGHLKDYRERGLFGKHRGIYWWDHYVRGDVGRGVVFKDYNVSPN
jgi:hypothetical protein